MVFITTCFRSQSGLILSLFGFTVLIASIYDAFKDFIKTHKSNDIEPMKYNSCDAENDIIENNTGTKPNEQIHTESQPELHANGVDHEFGKEVIEMKGMDGVNQKDDSVVKICENKQGILFALQDFIFSILWVFKNENFDFVIILLFLQLKW